MFAFESNCIHLQIEVIHHQILASRRPRTLEQH